MRSVRFRDESGATRVGSLNDRTIESDDQSFDLETVRILPPTEPTKILGVGPNHVSNVESKEHYEWPASPSELYLFIKTVPNTLVGHGDTVVLEKGGEYLFELELGIVIGEECKAVPEAEAMTVVEGFTCVNEITNIGLPEGFEPTDAARSKSFDDSAPVGPVVASPELVPEDAEMELRVNGDVRQSTNRSELIFSTEELIHEITQHTTLYPGDIIATGSPTGAGTLSDGDRVELEIEGIGTLEHDVRIE